MICEKCKQRQATVHLTSVFCDRATKTDLCVECARDMPEFANALTPGHLTGADRYREMLKAALGDHPRYPIEAYEFVCEVLDFYQKSEAENPEKKTIRHVAGKDLLEIIRQLILIKFDQQAKAVLTKWNIFRTEDFGEIVFEMINAGCLTKSPEDSKEDFKNGFKFDDVFPET
jgi:uncharacterized repeat protein (TIGR04138 family)